MSGGGGSASDCDCVCEDGDDNDDVCELGCWAGDFASRVVRAMAATKVVVVVVFEVEVDEAMPATHSTVLSELVREFGAPLPKWQMKMRASAATQNKQPRTLSTREINRPQVNRKKKTISAWHTCATARNSRPTSGNSRLVISRVRPTGRATMLR